MAQYRFRLGILRKQGRMEIQAARFVMQQLCTVAASMPLGASLEELLQKPVEVTGLSAIPVGNVAF